MLDIDPFIDTRPDPVSDFLEVVGGPCAHLAGTVVASAVIYFGSMAYHDHQDDLLDEKARQDYIVRYNLIEELRPRLFDSGTSYLNEYDVFFDMDMEWLEYIRNHKSISFSFSDEGVEGATVLVDKRARHIQVGPALTLEEKRGVITTVLSDIKDLTSEGVIQSPFRQSYHLQRGGSSPHLVPR